MGWEPQKFFVGLIDFFSVWLPGALLVYLTKDGLGLLLLGHELPISGTEGWAVFLFVSYVVGHFVFAVGSGLDKLLYDPLRAGTPGRQAARLAKGEELAPFWIRRIGSWLFERDDGPLHQILWLKDCRLARGNASAAINAFQWSKASLALRHPGALAEVERLEADSKFFRSLSVILALIGAWGVANLMAAPWLAGRSVLGLALMQPGRAAILAGGSALLLLGALARYLDRRSKAVRNAYQYLLTEAYAADAPVAAPTDDPRRLTHGGGVVVRAATGRSSIFASRPATNPAAGSSRRAISRSGRARARRPCARWPRRPAFGRACSARYATCGAKPPKARGGCASS